MFINSVDKKTKSTLIAFAASHELVDAVEAMAAAEGPLQWPAVTCCAHHGRPNSTRAN